MFDEPPDDPAERTLGPAERAREKADQFRMHAELVAVFEGHRKFDAELRPGLDPQIARDIRQTMGKLEKAKSPDSPVLPESSKAEATRLLGLFQTSDLSPNDYHIHCRPGEVMIVRWLEGDLVEAFYERLQAHFDAALAGCKEDERQARQWQQDPKTLAYLDALDKVEVKMAERYLREVIRNHNLFVLSTQAADEINISYLCDYIMEVSIADVVGPASAPPEEPTEQDLAWYFKLFSLRGMAGKSEQMCFFAYLQKSDETFE